MTLEAFLRLPEKKPALEFEDGMVTRKVSPQGRHSRLQVKVTERINAFAEPRRLAVAFTELRTTYAGYSRVPDVSVYRWDRIPVDATGKMLDDFHLPPDIAIEIISPGQRTNALLRRFSPRQVARAQHHLRALLQNQLRNGFPDAHGSPGNYRYFAFKFHIREVCNACRLISQACAI
jgi:hypothetical protein